MDSLNYRLLLVPYQLTSIYKGQVNNSDLFIHRWSFQRTMSNFNTHLNTHLLAAMTT